jgi:hypothetical protein
LNGEQSTDLEDLPKDQTLAYVFQDTYNFPSCPGRALQAVGVPHRSTDENQQLTGQSKFWPTREIPDREKPDWQTGLNGQMLST